MPRLTTHVLNQAEGIAASGIHITLERRDAQGHFHEIAQGTTNADGRLDAPLLEENPFGDQQQDGDPQGEGSQKEGQAGVYRLNFQVGDYFASRPMGQGMLGRVPVEFTLQATGHYHIPLLVTPWAYSVYRGS